MEQIYQQKIEESMNKAIPTIAYYSSIGLLTGSILETIMPEFNENKDSVALILEIFAQLTLVVFMFMFINSRGGVRNGLLVFTLSLVGTQPSLFQKMKALKINASSQPIKTKKVVDEEIEDDDNVSETESVNDTETTNKKEDNSAETLQQVIEPTPPQLTNTIGNQPMLSPPENTSDAGSSSIDSLPFHPNESASFGANFASPF
tara:strand:+ start:4677 stop:5288 length:612 start_codon:yes stop_codon:yes gene_type:complete